MWRDGAPGTNSQPMTNDEVDKKEGLKGLKGSERQTKRNGKHINLYIYLYIYRYDENILKYTF